MWVIVAAGGWESCSIYSVREDRLSHAQLLLLQRDRDAGESYDCLKLNSSLEKEEGGNRHAQSFCKFKAMMFLSSRLHVN